MEELVPALVFGFVTAYITFITVGNLFRDYPIIWWISGIVLGITTILIYMCEGYEAVVPVLGACGAAACVLVLVKWIKGQL